MSADESTHLTARYGISAGLAEKLDSGDMQGDPLTFLLDLVARDGDLVRFEKIHWAPTCLVNRPEHIGSVSNSPSDLRQIAGSLARRVFLSPAWLKRR